MTPRLEKAAGAYQMELNAEKRRDSEHQTPWWQMGANWKRIKDKDLGSSVSNEDGATKLI